MYVLWGLHKITYIRGCRTVPVHLGAARYFNISTWYRMSQQHWLPVLSQSTATASIEIENWLWTQISSTVASLSICTNHGKVAPTQLYQKIACDWPCRGLALHQIKSKDLTGCSTSSCLFPYLLWCSMLSFQDWHFLSSITVPKNAFKMQVAGWQWQPLFI